MVSKRTYQAVLAIGMGAVLWTRFVDALFVIPYAPEPAPASAATSAGELDDLIQALRGRVTANPADGSAAVQLADALLRAARVHADASLPVEAERVLTATLRTGDDYIARRMLAAVYLSQHRFAEGLDLARKAQAERPDDAWNYATAGDALVELGRYDEAFDMFDRAVARRPDAGVYARVAYAKELRGDLQGAIGIMRMAAEATPPQDVEAQAWVTVQVGLLHLHTGDVSAADREFSRAEFLFPGHPYALNGRIRLAIARKQYDEALRLAERAPATPESLAMRGDLLTRLGRPAAAERAYLESERLERDGWASEQPQPGALARFLAERDRDIPEAVRLAERAAAERSDINTMDALAWAYFKAGRLHEARQASERAVRTGTADPRIRCHAAAITQSANGSDVVTCDPLDLSAGPAQS